MVPFSRLKMPPKQQGPSKKTQEKQKEKVIEDKTFGLKNKKGAKQQKFIQQVQSQVKQQSAQKVKSDEVERKKEKDRKQKELDELNALFKSVEQAVPKGVDPKSIVCDMFKKAKCSKGDKCKFSHDLNVGKKAQKINMYEDKRDNADQDGSKGAIGQSNRSNTVCKYFLEAVEKKLYGWFWVCPKGGNACVYRHALPEGYVLKSEKKETEELIEKERAMISDTTKVTLETFLIWKKKKLKEKQEKLKSTAAKKQADANRDKTQGLSGREMFTFKSNIAQDDVSTGEEQVIDYLRDQEDGEGGDAGISNGPVREIDLEAFSMQIIEENEAELARQLAQQKSASSFDNSHVPSTSSEESKNADSKMGASNSEPNPDEAGPSCSSNSNVDGPGGLEIDEALFAGEIDQLDDLHLSDEEDDDDEFTN